MQHRARLKRGLRALAALTALLALSAPLAYGQLYGLETEEMTLVYTGKLQEYLVPQVVRSFENSLRFHQGLFDYTPSERIRVLVHDLWDYGNAGARPVPHNNITVGIAPYAMLYDSSPGNERINSSMNHEMVHLVTTDKATRGDRFFRGLFFGKVNPTAEQPISMLYSYLTTPRWYTPRWYLEGLAVYLETWMNGGLGRAIGAYDEMVFRTMVRDQAYVYDVVGLESEGTTIDFHVGVNAYLYGTRFVSFLAYRYGNEKLLAWYNRSENSKRYFTTQFEHVYGFSLTTAWAEWIAWEHGWQEANLELVRQNPITPHRPLTGEALGSVSRAFYDPDRQLVYVAVRYPGQVAHLASIDVRTGSIEKLREIIGASGFNVTSLAYDANSRTLFYTTNNNNWRHLVAIDVETGKARTLIRDARTGDLAFNPADRSLWGVRHFNGISTIVRIPHPYTEWNQVHSLPYGQDVFDLDVSPDGEALVASASEISGKQRLVRLNIPRLLEGDASQEVLFDFGNWSPGNFVFSADGAYLYGTSYYSGVSNVYRYDVERALMQPLSNAESGLFRPVPISDDSLLAFLYTGKGLVPSMIPNQVPERVSAIQFLGNEIVKKEPLVRTWALKSPTRFDVDSLVTREGLYAPIRHLKLDAAYPIVEGYKSTAAVGVRANFSDQLFFSRLALRASFTPDRHVPNDERWHAGLDFDYLNFGLKAAYNNTDFYDLFGPTKTSRKGYSLAVRYRRSLLFDEPRTLHYTVGAAGYAGLERLPEFQNVAASFGEMLTAHAGLDYSFLRRSLGAVEDEQGVAAGVTLQSNYVRRQLYPRLHADLDLGFLLPLDHSSIWLRGSAGQSLAADRDDPFGRFYFGSFGNNWVDHGAVKRFRDYDSFPGVPIDAVGGSNYGKAQVEWVLPPLRFRRVGVPSLYLRWASLSLIGTGLTTDVDDAAMRRGLAAVGSQLDLRLVSFSHLNSTLSVGYAFAFEQQHSPRREFMISLKLL